MGSTFVDFRGKGFEAADAALEVWLALLVRQIDELGEAPGWLREAREEWHLQASSGFGFGVIPDLERFITDDQRRDTVLALCRGAIAELEGCGEVIPRDELNALQTGGAGSTFTSDASALPFLRTGRYFVKLLDGTLSPTEIDARFDPR